MWHSREKCTATADAIVARVLRCVRKSNSDNLSELTERMCDRRTKPREVNYCQIPCPGHCVVSGWSEWSACPQV